MRVRLPSNYWKYRGGRGATRHMVLVHLPTGTGENGLKVTIDNNNHTISLHYPLAQIMLDPQALFTGAAFKNGYYVANDASRPALDAIQRSVDNLLYMDDEVTCETTISVDQVELSFTDKKICHLDDKITVSFSLSPRIHPSRKNRRSCSRKSMGACTILSSSQISTAWLCRASGD
mmetsp:Transcript_2672/g.6151  ORF Transcript_2672/g.6151 Transcript_2672/m.6151 type:complete len:176 (-) Transcript_2672:16-543(-)